MTASTKINDFRAKLTGGGARGSQFEVALMFPSYNNIDQKSSERAVFMVTSTTLPISYIVPIEVHYRGRAIKIAGERQFQNWSVTIMVDGDMKIRQAFEVWSAMILNHSQTNGILAPKDYQQDMTVTQLDRNNKVLRTYKMRNCFPQAISEIRLDYADTQNIERFNVEFSCDYWEVLGETDSMEEVSARPTAGGA